MRAIVGSMMMLVATPAVAADQFDLICTVTTKKSGGEIQPYPAMDIRIRVDLVKRLYCQGDCAEVEPIYRASFDEIVFASFREGDVELDQRVNRRTGAFSWSVSSGPSNQTLLGKCSVVAFTGFPERKF